MENSVYIVQIGATCPRCGEEVLGHPDETLHCEECQHTFSRENLQRPFQVIGIFEETQQSFSFEVTTDCAKSAIAAVAHNHPNALILGAQSLDGVEQFEFSGTYMMSASQITSLPERFPLRTTVIA